MPLGHAQVRDDGRGCIQNTCNQQHPSDVIRATLRGEAIAVGGKLELVEKQRMKTWASPY